MSNFAIRVENLSKQYRIGQREPYKTLRDTLADFAAAPLKMMGRANQNTGGAQNSIWALHDVSFEVPHGEAIGIIGRNGAGKSTLLKILSRITEPTTGRALIHGRVGSLLEVGTGFNPELTGRENIFLNGAILGMRRNEIERKFDEIVAFAEIEKFIDTPVKRYSSGMYMRLAFAVAAHLEPEILVIDEVLAVGDAAFQKKCLGKMSEVAHEGRTVLFVSHNMPAILRLCSRAVLLDRGQLIQTGSTQEVVQTYLSDTAEGGASQTWNLEASPGNADLRLLSVKVSDATDTMKQVFSVEDTIRITFEYLVQRSPLRFRCAAIFYTQGTCAFTSVEPFENTYSQTGRYLSTVTIPAHLLAEGEYSLSVSIFASHGVKSHLIRKNDIVIFQVVDPVNGLTARGDYTEGLLGVMRPKLNWILTFKDHA